MPYCFKPQFLTTLVASLAASGLFVACAMSPQPQPVNSQATNPGSAPGGMPGMDHSTMGNGTMGTGTMGHSMAMDLGPADADYDWRFIDAMTPHHQGGVTMAKELQQKSKRPEMQKLAAEIIKAQEKEIAAMKQWRTAWYPKADATPMAWHNAGGHMMAMSPEQMQGMRMEMDLGPANAEFDLRFINAMVPHHEGALVMAKDALDKSKRPEIRQLAQAILTSQQAEIDQMKQWRKDWYKK